MNEALTTSVDERKAMIVAFFERAWGRHDVDAYDTIVHPDVTLHLAGYSEPIQGRGAVKDWVSMYQGAFPDISIEIRAITVDGDHAFLLWHSTQTQSGDYLGIKALGDRVAMDVLQLFRFEGDLAAEVWIHFDPLAILQQLRVIPPGQLPKPLLALINPIRRLRRSRR
jgi:predicted ester cyclase